MSVLRPFAAGAELFALVALIYFACFLMTGLRHARRRPARP